jgi:hypothetical protein
MVPKAAFYRFLLRISIPGHAGGELGGEELGFDVRADVGVVGWWDGGLQIAEPGACCAG